MLVAEAAAHANVMTDPAPMAFFMGFGDSALNFELRFWSARQDIWFQLKSDVTTGVSRALREAGIELPFPQRDAICAAQACRSQSSERLMKPRSARNGELEAQTEAAGTPPMSTPPPRPLPSPRQTHADAEVNEFYGSAISLTSVMDDG